MFIVISNSNLDGLDMLDNCNLYFVDMSPEPTHVLTSIVHTNQSKYCINAEFSWTPCSH